MNESQGEVGTYLSHATMPPIDWLGAGGLPTEQYVAEPGDDLVNSLANVAGSFEWRTVVAKSQFMRVRHAR